MYSISKKPHKKRAFQSTKGSIQFQLLFPVLMVISENTSLRPVKSEDTNLIVKFSILQKYYVAEIDILREFKDITDTVAWRIN